MTTAVLLILGVMALVVLSSVASSWLARGARLMRELGEAFPYEPPDAESVSGGVVSASIGSSGRPAEVRLRCVLDMRALHLRLDAGPLGPDRRATLPWDSMTLEHVTSVKHWGQVTMVKAGAFRLTLPAHLVEGYLAPAAPQAPEQPLVEKESVEPD